MKLYGAFDLNNYKFTAEFPSTDEENLEWKITIKKDDKVVHEHVVPMIYKPIFGPDVGDVEALNAFIEKIIKDLGIE